MTRTVDVLHVKVDTEETEGSIVAEVIENPDETTVLGHTLPNLRDTYEEDGLAEILMMAAERRGPLRNVRDWVYDRSRGWEPETVYTVLITDDGFSVEKDGEPVDLDEWEDKYWMEECV